MEESKQSVTNKYKYHAFISYRHADNKVQGRQWATWLHQAIETYEVPKDLVGKKNGRGDVIPARIYPIFRDEEELPAHADLGTSIVGALEQTNLLVVLCSPRAVASTYVADEIDYFKKLGGSDRIIAAMIDGEPNTSWDDSKHSLGFTKEDECFPLPLQFEYDQDGNPTDKHAEPIAADFRINNNGKPEEGFTTPAAYREHLKKTTKLDNKAIDKKVDTYQQQLHLMLLKVIAGILGVPLGELTQRDKEYQLEQERLKAKKLRQWLGAVAMLAILAVGAGVFAYIQKNRAEVLLDGVRHNLNFLNVDLRNALENYVPIDVRADMLKQVDDLMSILKAEEGGVASDQHAAATAYMNQADFILKSDAAAEEALLLFQKAKNILTLLTNEYPENRNFQRSLSISYSKLGQLQLGRGDTAAALEYYKASHSIREKLSILARDPLNPLEPLDPLDLASIRFQRDLSISHVNIGDLQLRLGDKDAALVHYQAGMVIRDKLKNLDPNNIEFQRDLSISHNRLGDLRLRIDEIDAAIEHYQVGIAIREKLTILDPSNTMFQRDLSVSHNKLGDLQLRLGDKDAALAHYQEGIFIRKKLMKLDPNNAEFQYDLSFSYSSIAKAHAKGKDFISASDSLMSYIKITGIDTSKKIVTQEKILLLKRLSGSYLNWSWYMLYTEKVNEVPNMLTKVISYLPENEDNTVILHTNLAHAYLLSGDYQIAKSIYTKYKEFKFKNGKTWQMAILADFKALEKDDITHPDFERIAKEVFGESLESKPPIKNKEAV